MHMPVGCGLFSAIAVAEEVARRTRVLLPPPIPVAFPFRTSSPTISLSVETMRRLLDDYFRAPSEMGVSKVVVLSGCGQLISALNAICKELSERLGVKVILTRVKMLIRDEASSAAMAIFTPAAGISLGGRRSGLTSNTSPAEEPHGYVHLVHETGATAGKPKVRGIQRGIPSGRSK